ncbi:TetR/AcrR family transcriptional regulator [Mesorhizobium hawassense]|uniref:TetR/AcrR family transcriptional regulator n=1 Tax=Mesorhizobium hawassense TaxID=1209954 RepID=A0A330HTX3_9HYPH|nr:TetR family transcriptional regulator [Mesorhizobium hawassense]RAZ91845.1 TetR/AcrR family transcriptional regulator [Mesorhizobium hawassense]
MHHPIGMRTDLDEVRARILEVAEERFRRIGYHKTSMADIASDVGMSRGNVYRFFPSRDAITGFICERTLNEAADIAFAIARTNATAPEKLSRLLIAVHQHGRATLIEQKHMHDMIVAVMQENWAIVKAHIEWMVAIFEAIIREGIEAGELDVGDPAEAARAVKTAFMPFFHPVLIEHCVKHGEDTDASLREQIRFILKALAKSD